MNALPSIGEINLTILVFNVGKAAGKDGMCTEIFQYGRETAGIFTACQVQEKCFEQWENIS